MPKTKFLKLTFMWNILSFPIFTKSTLTKEAWIKYKSKIKYTGGPIMHDVYRDTITVEDGCGIQEEFTVEAMFEMKGQSYAMLKSARNQTIVMKVEDDGGEQYLVNIKSQEDFHSILDAYQIAVEGTEGLEPQQ
jgi:hypothetical protein